jgi:transposase
MSAPYSADLRLRVLQALDEGMSKMKAHKTYRVARSTIDDWLKLRATTGQVRALPRSAQKRVAALSDRAAFESFAKRHCHSTLAGMKVAWHTETGQLLSINTFSLALKGIGWTHKKRVGSTPSVWSPDVP